MTGTQKWKDDEIWFILNLKRRGAKNVDIVEMFRKSFPKHHLQKDDLAPINYVWTQYSSRPEYAPEKSPELAEMYGLQRNTQVRSAKEDQYTAAGPSASSTSMGVTGTAFRNFIPPIMTAPAKKGLVPRMESVFGEPLRATFNSPQPLNMLLESLPTLGEQAFTRAQSQQTLLNSSLGFEEIPKPKSSFPSTNSEQADPFYSSQSNLANSVEQFSSPPLNRHTISQSRVEEKRRRPPPTSTHRSNAKFTGFRHRRGSPDFGTTPFSNCKQRQNLPPKMRSPPTRQLLRQGPIEVARYQGYSMTFDARIISGLPYTVYAPDGSIIRNGNDLPEGIFDQLSAMSARHPSHNQQFSTHDAMQSEEERPWPANFGSEMGHQVQMDQSINYIGSMHNQGHPPAFVNGTGGAQMQGQLQPNAGYPRQIYEQDLVQAEIGQMDFAPPPEPSISSFVPSVEEYDMSPFFPEQMNNSTQSRATDTPGRMSTQSYRDYNNAQQGYENDYADDSVTGVIYPANSFHAPISERYHSNQNPNAHGLAATHRFNYDPIFNNPAPNFGSNQPLPQVQHSPRRGMGPPPGRPSSNLGQPNVATQGRGYRQLGIGLQPSLQHMQPSTNNHRQENSQMNPGYRAAAAPMYTPSMSSPAQREMDMSRKAPNTTADGHQVSTDTEFNTSDFDNTGSQQAFSPQLPGISPPRDLGLGINMYEPAMSIISPRVQQSPTTGNLRLTRVEVQGVSATQDARIINISGATFVAPFIIPSHGNGWALEGSTIPQDASSGHCHGDFILSNAGTRTVINIVDSTFRMGLEFEDLLKALHNRQPSVPVSFPAPSNPRQSSRSRQNTMNDAEVPPVKPPVVRRGRSKPSTANLQMPEPRDAVAAQGKRQAELPIPESTPTKRQKTMEKPQSVATNDTFSNGDSVPPPAPRVPLISSELGFPSALEPQTAASGSVSLGHTSSTASPARCAAERSTLSVTDSSPTTDAPIADPESAEPLDQSSSTEGTFDLAALFGEDPEVNFEGAVEAQEDWSVDPAEREAVERFGL